MKVSVITVCYNAVNDIEKTIISVLNQIDFEFEYIIIDGASTDGTIDMINKYKKSITKVVSEPDNGIYDAMNKGIKLATGDWINFMNAGDTFYNDRVLSNFFKDVSDKTIIAYGDTNYVFSVGVKVRRACNLNMMEQKMCFGHQSTFVKTSYHKSHLFDTSYKSSGDYKMLYDAYFKDQVKFQYIPQIVANFEAEHGMSTSNAMLVMREDARLKGIDKNLCWKIKYFFRMIEYKTKLLIKSFLPKRYLDVRKKKYFDNFK